MAIPDISEGEKLDRYVRGQPMLRKEVIMRDPSSFDEAVGMAVRFDSLRAFATGRTLFKNPTLKP